jgi:hypothetical protein
MFGASAEIRALERVCGAALAGAERGLCVGRKLPAAPNLRGVPAPEAASALAPGFDALVWRLDRRFADGFRLLRPLLSPGARLVFVAELVPSVWGVARELLGGTPLPRFSREEIGEAALLHGLLGPRVWLETSRVLTLSAQLPARLEALDELFSQPALADAR